MNKEKLKEEKVRVNPLEMFSVRAGKVVKKSDIDAVPHLFFITLDKICPNRFQPRTNFDEAALNELAESIKARGVIQPIIVRRLHRDTVSQDGIEYELIAGERRLRASKIAGLKDIPAVIKEASDDDLRTLALIENIQREDLTVMEKAIGIIQLKNTIGDKEVVAKTIGMSTRTIERNIRLAEADEVYQNMIIEQRLSFRVADKLTLLGGKIDRLKNKDQSLYNRLIKKLQKEQITEELLDKVEADYLTKKTESNDSDTVSQKQIKKENFYETEIEFGLNLKVKKSDALTDEQKNFLTKQAENFFTGIGAKEVNIKF